MHAYIHLPQHRITYRYAPTKFPIGGRYKPEYFKTLTLVIVQFEHVNVSSSFYLLFG